jgi:membrane-bound serine protease (ClpP class)
MKTGEIALMRMLRLFVLTSIMMTSALATYAQSSTTETVSADKPKVTEGDRVQSREEVVVIKLDDEIINPVTARFIGEGIAEAEKADVPLVIQIDTPGGLLQSTREIVKKILGAKVPVITYVHPSGSRAASAGVFIAYASHIAAMSPSTNIGAAHVVNIGGSWPGRKSKKDDDNTDSSTTATQGRRKSDDHHEQDEYEEETRDVMSEKIMNDTLAWIEGIARLRNRNAEWAKDAVNKSESITAEDALKLNVIDHVAKDIPELLSKIDGTTVPVQGGIYTIKSKGVTSRLVELTTRQRILNVLANPNIAYILLLIGFAGLAYEVTHPGLIIPGVGGAVALLLAAFALQMLPTNYAAVLLIVAGLGLIIAEIKFTSYGLLTFAGAVCLFFGSLALFDSPGPFMGVSLSVIIPVVFTVVGLLALLVYLVIRTHAIKPTVGMVSFVGDIAEVATPINPEGKVFYNGSYWNAVSTGPLAPGTKVRIVAMDKLRLLVEPIV